MDAKEISYITQLVVEALSKAGTTPTDAVGGIPVGVSARHIHLTQAAVEALFGTGHQLTKKKALMGGQYACNETVMVVSPKMKFMENIRVLGPVRKANQIEISSSDAMKLGSAAPLRESGDVAGSAPMTLIGPCGTVYLNEGCIVAARHIHMSPDDATRFGVKEGDFVSVKYGGARPTLFENVKIRVDPSFTLEMHIDTDEANAAGLKTGDKVSLVS
ncbi:MAG: phosphate propanoyltransferase [Gemmiger sp.]|nr:phosphate propanoyltransferase [Gemmiger sp.]